MISNERRLFGVYYQKVRFVLSDSETNLLFFYSFNSTALFCLHSCDKIKSLFVAVMLECEKYGGPEGSTHCNLKHLFLQMKSEHAKRQNTAEEEKQDRTLQVITDICILKERV